MAKFNVDSPEVIEKLKEFELKSYKRLPCHHYNTGHCIAEIFDTDEDDDFFDVEVIWGIDNDDTNTELWTMDKETLEIDEFFEE